MGILHLNFILTIFPVAIASTVSAAQPEPGAGFPARGGVVTAFQQKPKPKPGKPDPGGELPRDPKLLLEFLKSDNVEIRRKAVEGLAALGLDARDAIPTLTKTVRDDRDKEVRRLATVALGAMGVLAKDAVMNIHRGTGDSDAGLRRASIEALGNIGAPSFFAVDSLLKIVRQDADAELRLVAATACVQIFQKSKDEPSRKSAIVKFTEMLRDPGAGSRIAMVSALGAAGRGARDFADAIRTLSESDPDADVKTAAAKALQQIEAEEDEAASASRQAPAASGGTLQFASFDAIIEALKSRKSSLRREAVAKLIQLKAAAVPAIPQLRKSLREDDDVVVREGAARALAAMGPAAEPALHDLGLAMLSKTEHEHVREAAAVAIGQIGPRALTAYPALVRAWVEDERYAVRKAASNTLFQKMQAPVKEVALLVRDVFIQTREDDVRSRAAVALSELGPAAKDTIPILTKALKDPSAIVRRGAATALGEFEEGARVAVPELLLALNDTDPNVVKRAKAAIARIDPAALPAPPPPPVAEAPASKPAESESPPAPVATESKPARPTTLAGIAAELVDGEAGMSKPTVKVENDEIHLSLQLEHSRFDEAMAHTDAVRLSMKFFENIPDLKQLRVSILHFNGKLLSTKTVTAERVKPFLAIEDPYERRRMRDWWGRMAE